MPGKRNHLKRVVAALSSMLVLVFSSTQMRADTGTCGGQSITLPFTDVLSSNVFFCTIAEAFFTGLTNGTSPTTYNPSDPVNREQMAAFITRTLDQSLKRGSNRAVLDQFWTSQGSNNLISTTVGSSPALVKSDGADLWVANQGSSTVARVRSSDGKLIETWTGASAAFGVLVAMGKVFVTGGASSLYQIDPTQSEGAVTTLTQNLGGTPRGIAFDGEKIWTANALGSFSRVTFLSDGDVVVATNIGLFNQPSGMLYDGAHMWMTDAGDDRLIKFNSNGTILQSISVGDLPLYPAFDGTNIWVPNASSGTVTVVRVKDSQGNPLPEPPSPNAPFVLATLSGNGLSNPFAAAFDGERILVTNTSASSLSLWKASDLTPIGTFSTGTSTSPRGVCSDGLNFWITLNPSGITDKLVRF